MIISQSKDFGWASSQGKFLDFRLLSVSHPPTARSRLGGLSGDTYTRSKTASVQDVFRYSVLNTGDACVQAKT